MHLAPMIHEPARRLQPKQTAAYHRGARAVFGRCNDPVAIIDGAEAEYAPLQLAVGPVQPLHGWNEGPATRRNQQHIIAGASAASRLHQARGAVDLGYRRSCVKRNPVLLIPGERVDEYLGSILQPAQNVGKQDAVVIAVRLVAEHRNVEQLGPAACQNLLHGAGAGHAVADDHQTLLGHAAGSSSKEELLF